MTRKFLLSALLILSVSLVSFIGSEDDILKHLITRLLAYQSRNPQEKLYLHFDRPYYAAGENLWFKAYLVDGTYHRMDSSVSKVIYVELLNSSNKILDRKALYAPAGSSYGDFQLADTLSEGNYLVRAYTNYMKNYREEFFFQKEISILNALVKKTGGPEVAESIVNIQFFPEGGNLVAGVDNRIVFKAMNSFGKSVDVEGDIIDDENKVITSFASEHKGMGSLRMMVFSQKKYKARLRKPSAVAKEFMLPQAIEKGYLMQLVDAGANIKLVIYNNQEKIASSPVLFNLIGQTRGEVYFAAKGEIKTSTVTALIPKNKFPSGIAQFTVFDGHGLPQCERLFFIDHQQTLNVDIKPDKTVYSKREKVTLGLTVRNREGQPVKGDFSISIYDNNAVKNFEDYPVTIENYLLLISDLPGYIEEPGYYFKDKSPETLRHLDLLMLTHGWRRFVWKDILTDEQKPVQYFAERGISISGSVGKTLSGKAAANSKLKIFNSQGDFVIVDADENGRFYTDDLVYFDSTKLAIQTENVKGKQLELKLELDPFNIPPSSHYIVTPFPHLKSELLLKQAQNRLDYEKALKLAQDERLLKEVVVSASKIDETNKPKVYGTPSATVQMKDIPQTYTNVFQALQGRVPGIQVRGVSPNMTISLRAGNTEPPLFLLNGTPVDADVINSIPVTDVSYVDVLKGTASAIFGSRGQNGVVAVYTKATDYTPRKALGGMQHYQYPGLYLGKEFYSPSYDVPDDKHSYPDIRNTLYWNPVVETDEQGKAQVSFYSSDVASAYSVIIQGLSFEGDTGYGTSSLQIKD
jgi:hypothetical protein